MSIKGIHSDQWFGIRADNDHKADEVFVACDRVEHGLTAIWSYDADKRGGAVDG